MLKECFQRAGHALWHKAVEAGILPACKAARRAGRNYGRRRAERAMSIPDNQRQFDDGEAWRVVAVFETTEVELQGRLTPAFVGVCRGV
jgi:hypothetical protein